jgi:hypothetical protein
VPGPPRPRRRWGPALFALVAAILAWALSPELTRPVAEGGHFGPTSLLPALTTLVLVFLTRDVVSSLFLGIAVAGFVVSDLDIVDRFLLPSLASESFAVILLVYLWALGGLIGLWTRTGGAREFARAASARLVTGPRSA